MYNDKEGNDMTHPDMTIRRLLTALLMTVLAATAAMAQADLSIAKAFDRYGHSKGCKMVEMTGTKLKGYDIHVYRSMTYRKIAAEVEPYLKEDRKKAKKIREVVEDGRIMSGYYMMPPRSNGMNRYILFSNKNGGSGAIVYIEAHISPDDIMRICYAKW